MDFYAIMPNINPIMCHTQITGLLSALGMDVRIVYTEITKIRYVIMQGLAHKITCHIFITIGYG